MKDYTFGRVFEEDFILNYTITDNQLVINYANKKRQIMPYTKDLEIEVLNQMKNQVMSFCSYDNLQYLKRRMIVDLKLSAYYVGSSILFALLFCFGDDSVTTLKSFAEDKNVIGKYLINAGCDLLYGVNGLFSIVSAVMFYSGIKTTLKSNELYKDMKKHLLYLENEEYINKLYNLNDIDKMSLKSVNKIIKQKKINI